MVICEKLSKLFLVVAEEIGECWVLVDVWVLVGIWELVGIWKSSGLSGDVLLRVCE